MAWLTPYLEHLHGIVRPSNQTADAVAGLVLRSVPVQDHTRVVALVWPVTQCVIAGHAGKEWEALLENP